MNFDGVLIFRRTKVNADRVAHYLKYAKHSVAVLHSNRTQRKRIEALEGFKSSKQSRDQSRCAGAFRKITCTASAALGARKMSATLSLS
jgi:hypothetical protein